MITPTTKSAGTGRGTVLVVGGGVDDALPNAGIELLRLRLGAHFTPPLSSDELAFYDAVATNESAVELQGEDVLAQIARELVGVMQRDTKTDWTVRDDVRAKLRSSIKRLLVKYKYPPDKQPEEIKLVIEQMEAMAPRYAEDARRSIGAQSTQE
jgi:hypothetical protein